MFGSGRIHEKLEETILRYFIIVGMGRSGSTSLFSQIIANEKINCWSNYSDRFASKNVIIHKLINRFCARMPQGGRNTWITKNDYSNLLPRPTEGFRTLTSIFGRQFPYSYGAGLAPSSLQISRFEEFSRFADDSVDCDKIFGLKVTGPAKIKFWQSVNPNIKIIYLRRNPYEQIASHLKTGFWREGGGNSRLWWKYDIPKYFQEFLNQAEASGVPEALLAAQWRAINEFAQSEIESSPFPDNILTIDYDEFKKFPNNCLTQIGNFLNVEIENVTSKKHQIKSNKKIKHSSEIKFWLEKEI